MTREFKAWLTIAAACLLSLICTLISYPSYAQETQPTTPVCAPLRELTDFLKSEYGEELRWFGDSPMGGRLAVLDSKEGTWTLFQTDGQTACVLSSGKGSTFKLGEPA